MRFLVTGVNGQLGHDVLIELTKRGHECIGSGRLDSINWIDGDLLSSEISYIKLDITNETDVRNVLYDVRPNVVIHCAAWTNVDLAEDKNQIDQVYAVNVVGTENIARVCKEIDCCMLYLSTDYVFDGQGTEPWEADCNTYNPLNVYGRTKMEGELAVCSALKKYFIVRTSWAFGLNGRNFVKTMLELGKKCDEVRVINDQIGTPTYTYDLARLLVDMCETDKYGFYNATNSEVNEFEAKNNNCVSGYISWYDFCVEIFKIYGIKTKVIPISTAEYDNAKAVRPLNSRLSKRKLTEAGFSLLPSWRDALTRYLKLIKI